MMHDVIDFARGRELRLLRELAQQGECGLPYLVARYGIKTLLAVLERGELRVEGTRVFSPARAAGMQWLEETW